MSELPFDDERTIIRPLPPSGPPRHPEPPPPAPPPAVEDMATGENPLLRASTTLLLLVTQLNSTTQTPGVDALHQRLMTTMRTFEETVGRQGVDEETARRASYVLCTVLDEAILNTPWGHASGWAQRSLLSLFHKEVSGGKRFFEMLRSLMRHPEKHLDLLELMYVCLSLGFEGSYRIEAGGREQLERIRNDLYQFIDRRRGSREKALSPHWQGVATEDLVPHRWPLWAIAAVAAAGMGGLYGGLVLWLNRMSDPVLTTLYTIPLPDVTIPPPTAPTPPPAVRLTLTDLLAPEVEKGQVWVLETERQAQVTLGSGTLFASGSAEVSKRALPVLERIGKALDQVEGDILITGHTDDRPIRSVRFPSNWHLSKARAEAVAAVIERFLTNPARVTVEGRGDTEPIADNKTAAGRARNRRVEILLVR